MTGCCAVGCTNRDSKGFLMKRFPTDPERRKQWEVKVSRANSYLCEEMKDQYSNREEFNVPTIYKDVVIIGNGPGGLTASYVLSGYCPIYNGLGHSDPMLAARLKSSLNKDESVLCTEKITFLSQGMEELGGTSLAGTLFDSLLRPGTLNGLSRESPLSWQRRNKPLDHIVLGDGPPGGIWQRLDPDLVTLSVNSWMELPGLRMSQEHKAARRASVREVAEYYLRYATEKGLSKYHRECRVISVKHLDKKRGNGTRWEVRAVDKNGNEIVYFSKFCILANGSSVPKRLKVPGEEDHRVVHDLSGLEAKLANISTPCRVLVVGAGLSAGDAVLLSHFKGCEVIHSFRAEDANLGQILPEGLYPEYHKVGEMMRDTSGSYPGYCPLAGSTVTSLDEGRATLSLTSPSTKSSVTSVDFSVAAILIGNSSDLSFLRGFAGGLHLTEKEGCSEISPKENPVIVDPYTYQVPKVPGLYAIGALVGDIYVRYIPGGAVAASAHILNQMEQLND